MGLREKFKAYGDYEAKELARRAAKKKKIRAYKELASKARKAPKRKPLRMTAKGITKAIDNPYGVKFPKAKKALKKVRRRRRNKK